MRLGGCLTWVLVLAAVGGGCGAPPIRLSFPAAAIERTDQIEWFDVSGDGRKDFGVRYAGGRLDQLLYDDDEDGRPDRVYRLSDYSNGEVPHAIILLDSIPFQTVKDRYDAGDFRWFDPPVKSIATFPSLTELCYTEVLQAPPLPGVIDQYYDPISARRMNVVGRRIMGYREPWELRLHYSTSMTDQGMAYLNPKPWLAAEFERARQVIQQSADNVTVVYLASPSAVVCRYSKPGAEEVLDGARQLCLQLLYERHGAIKISMMADHGHNYMTSKLVRLDQLLEAGGFHPADRINNDDDVVIELNGLVTGASMHTRQPALAAGVLLKDPAVELVVYLDQDRAIVSSAAGSAAIDCRNGKLRYQPIDADVLDLSPMVQQLQRDSIADSDGYVDDAHWFAATIDHAWPDAPRRIWDALHRQEVYAPTLLISIRDGFYAGLPQYTKWINMQSTHGGLNQINSATFVLTMTGNLDRPVRQRELLPTLIPGFEPRVLRR